MSSYRFRVQAWGSEFGVQGLGFRVLGLRVQGLGFRISNFTVQGVRDFKG